MFNDQVRSSYFNVIQLKWHFLVLFQIFNFQTLLFYYFFLGNLKKPFHFKFNFFYFNQSLKINFNFNYKR